MKNKLGQVGIAALILSLALAATIVVAETNETAPATPTPEPTAAPSTPEAAPAATPAPASSPEPTTTPAAPASNESIIPVPSTSTPTPTPESTPQPSTPTPIQTPPKSEPQIEIIYPSKLTRGDATELNATVKNAGTGEIRITSLLWSLPSGFDITAKQEDCNVLKSGESCNSVVTVKTTTSVSLGKNDIKILASYG